MKTKCEIIRETFLFYSKNPDKRGLRLSEGTSVGYSYKNEAGNYCAVGRCLTKGGFGTLIENGLIDTFIRNVEKTLSNQRVDFQSIFKPEYAGHRVEFWADLQLFHDTNSNWDDSGITQVGLESYEELINKYQHEDNGTIAIYWGWEDVAERAKDTEGKSISKADCIKILERAKHCHDANEGINWEVLDIYIEQYLNGVLA